MNVKPLGRAVAKHFDRDGRRLVYDVYAVRGFGSQRRILVGYCGHEDEFGVVTKDPDAQALPAHSRIWATARRFTVTLDAGPTRVAV